jgi:hypothetical protein
MAGINLVLILVKDGYCPRSYKIHVFFNTNTHATTTYPGCTLYIYHYNAGSNQQQVKYEMFHEVPKNELTVHSNTS